MRDAGLNIKHTAMPGSAFWNDWTKYPFSATEWGPRPLGYPDAYEQTFAAARQVPVPAFDPLYGASGPLLDVWTDLRVAA